MKTYKPRTCANCKKVFERRDRQTVCSRECASKIQASYRK